MIVAANDDMALGALEAVQGAQLSTRSRSSASTRCPRRWRRSATAALTATIEQLPGGQSRGAVRDAGRATCATAPSPSRWSLLTPIAITKDNLDEAERLGEVK